MKSIVLIGMMGCGKTTCAKLLSDRLGWPVVDTDAYIEQSEGRSISEIFAADGEAYFRDLETRVAAGLSGRGGLIVATGGGLPLRQENMAYLKKNGVVFWLNRDPASTFTSVGMEGRPLAQNGQADFIARYEQRAPIYCGAADHVIEDFSSPETTVGKILELID